MMRLMLPVAALFAAAVATDAHAFCNEPSAPWGKPTKPTVPYCVNEWNNTHTCDPWEINSYNTDVHRYNNEVQAYIQGLHDYVEEAVAYAECEVENLG